MQCKAVVFILRMNEHNNCIHNIQGPMPSTVIACIEYEPEGQNLKITFNSGKVYRYHQVPSVIYERMKRAFSKGTFFNRFIRDQYAFTQIDV
jgi:hypothetical protein